MRTKYLGLLLVAFLAGAFTYHFVNQSVTASDVRGALRVAGLEFTDTEIDSLLPGVNSEFLTNYAAMRQLPIPNDLPPALYFDPLPTGMRTPTGLSEVSFSVIRNPSLPENLDELAFYNVRQLAGLIRSGQITSERLTRFFLDRLKRHDARLHCVVTLTEELALEQARRADAEIAAGQYRGLLHGIPYGAKDLLATSRYPTTWGATPYRTQSFDYDATVIKKLDKAGAVLVAKLSLGALAWGDVWFGGTTRNPWDPANGSSGSSAGSASAVAAGLVPFAIGTETLGSIVSPSTVCGVTGLRPTFGRVSRHGAMALSWSMDKIGPICRSAEDCLLVLSEIHGPDGKDHTAIEAPLVYTPRASDYRSLRIGYVEADFAGNYPFKAQDEATLRKLRELGYELVPIELPAMPPISHILSAEAAAAFDDLTRSNRDDELVRQVRAAWPNVFRQARLIPAVEYIQANRLRTRLIMQMDTLFRDQRIDLYVHPSWASASLRITNYTGHPCLVLPNGFGRDGKPTSISFTGQLFEEGKLAAVGQALQNATEWDDRRPPGF